MFPSYWESLIFGLLDVFCDDDDPFRCERDAVLAFAEIHARFEL